LRAEADDLAAKQRKRAGLPELQLDQFPSTISQKVMKLISKHHQADAFLKEQQVYLLCMFCGPNSCVHSRFKDLPLEEGRQVAGRPGPIQCM
jgi:hypothetical protein